MKFRVSETKGGKNQSHLSKASDFFVESGLAPNVDTNKLKQSSLQFIFMSIFLVAFVAIPLYIVWWGFKMFFGSLFGL